MANMITDAPMRVRVKAKDNSLFLLAVPGTELGGEQFYAMLLAYQVKAGWMAALYDGLRYYDKTLREMDGCRTPEHMTCLRAARAYIANLIWLAEMEQMEVELCQFPEPKQFAEG